MQIARVPGRACDMSTNGASSISLQVSAGGEEDCSRSSSSSSSSEEGDDEGAAAAGAEPLTGGPHVSPSRRRRLSRPSPSQPRDRQQQRGWRRPCSAAWRCSPPPRGPGPWTLCPGSTSSTVSIPILSTWLSISLSIYLPSLSCSVYSAVLGACKDWPRG